MALPLTRDITLASGTQIPSTLLNNLQDMIIGGKSGPRTLVIPAAMIAQENATYLLNNNTLRFSASANSDCPVLLNTGDRITSYSIVTRNSIAADKINFSLAKSAETVLTFLDGVTATDTSGAGLHTDTIILATPEIVATGESYIMTAQADGGNSSTVDLFRYLVVYDRL